jgi:hypothetical protein
MEIGRDLFPCVSVEGVGSRVKMRKCFFSVYLSVNRDGVSQGKITGRRNRERIKNFRRRSENNKKCMDF